MGQPGPTGGTGATGQTGATGIQGNYPTSNVPTFAHLVFSNIYGVDTYRY